VSQFVHLMRVFAIIAPLGGLNLTAKVGHQPVEDSIDLRLQLVEKEVQAVWALPRVRIATTQELIQRPIFTPKHFAAINRPEHFVKEWVVEGLPLLVDLHFQRLDWHPPVARFLLPCLHPGPPY